MFRNRSVNTCRLSGYPGAQLLRGGAPVGKPASHRPQRPHPVTLRPGKRAQSRLTVRTSCNAPVADAVRITPPGSTGHADRPVRLRACASSVTPVAAG